MSNGLRPASISYISTPRAHQSTLPAHSDIYTANGQPELPGLTPGAAPTHGDGDDRSEGSVVSDPPRSKSYTPRQDQVILMTTDHIMTRRSQRITHQLAFPVPAANNTSLVNTLQ